MKLSEFKEKYNNLQIPDDSYIYDANIFLLKNNQCVLTANRLSKYKSLLRSILSKIDISEKSWIDIIDCAKRLEKNSAFI